MHQIHAITNTFYVKLTTKKIFFKGETTNEFLHCNHKFLCSVIRSNVYLSQSLRCEGGAEVMFVTEGHGGLIRGPCSFTTYARPPEERYQLQPDDYLCEFICNRLATGHLPPSKALYKCKIMIRG